MGDTNHLDTKALLQNCHNNINLAWSNRVEHLIINNTPGKSIHMTDPVLTTFYCDNYVPVNQWPYCKAYFEQEAWTTTEAMTYQHDDIINLHKNKIDKLTTPI